MTYLIDGYNLLHALGMIQPKTAPEVFRRARERMLNWLNMVHPSPEDLIVVFDARKAPRLSHGEQSWGAVRVRFAHHMLADDMIEDILRETRSPYRWTVVSNDLRVQEAGRRRGCVVWRTDDLIDAIQIAPARSSGRSSARKEAASEKPDTVNEAEVREYLEIFDEPNDDDGIDRRGFGRRT